ncbi:MAG: bifunctional phosphoglucose/phosphomannose isomerase [Chloroflexi bacterium]|nr:bifunctional phosphoglucose/phosphomannose isomerase [Chloroflexota bacterium]
MNLDDLDFIRQHDPQDMLGEIEKLPAQLEKAWELGQSSGSRHLGDVGSLRQIIISGMGGSAIGADLVSTYIAPACPVPVAVHRDYSLPAWARGPETLVIASSHSGNTEETLDSFDAAHAAGCRLLAVCTGGELEKRARAVSAPVWKFAHQGQPRAAVGYSFGLLMAIFARLGLIPDPEKELLGAVAGMRSQQEALRADVPVAQNPAKRMAGQMVGRWVNVYGSGSLAPVARRWKGQVNELAKAGAGFEALPEADHNTLAGTLNPSDTLPRTFHLFLRAASDHPRNRLRLDLTRQALMLEGLNTDLYDAPGTSPLAQMWTAIHFGDYVAFYLAMAYGVDPTPVTALEEFKLGMKAA